MPKQDGSNPRPYWVPDWFPDPATVGYASGFLTAILLIIVGIYLVMHYLRGGTHAQAATIAAGVGVGGAGT